MDKPIDVFENCIVVQPDWLEFKYACSDENFISIKRKNIVAVYQCSDKSETMIYTEHNMFIVKMPYEEVMKLV